MTEPLRVGEHGAVRTPTLDRPEARNALSGALVTALYRVLRRGLVTQVVAHDRLQARAREIAAAHPPASDPLEQRRRDVLVRDRRQPAADGGAG